MLSFPALSVAFALFPLRLVVSTFRVFSIVFTVTGRKSSSKSIKARAILIIERQHKWKSDHGSLVSCSYLSGKGTLDLLQGLDVSISSHDVR